MQTIGQTAERLNVTTQTIRNYIGIAAEYFSTSARRQTGKRFNAVDVENLATIARMKASGQTNAEIIKQLTPSPEIIEDTEPIEQQHHHGQEQNSNALMVLLDATIAAHQQTIDVLRDEVQHLRTEQQISHAQGTVDAVTIAQLRSEIERLKRPWWQRFRD